MLILHILKNLNLNSGLLCVDLRFIIEVIFIIVDPLRIFDNDGEVKDQTIRVSWLFIKIYGLMMLYFLLSLIEEYFDLFLAV